MFIRAAVLTTDPGPYPAQVRLNLTWVASHTELHDCTCEIERKKIEVFLLLCFDLYLLLYQIAGFVGEITVLKGTRRVEQFSKY